MKIKILTLTIIYFFYLSFALKASDPPYHQTNAYGTQTKGGIEGKIIKVTNLNNSGEGSLRAAIEAEGKRLVVFEVGGVIEVQDMDLFIFNPEITIAGQTAPSPGITLIKGGIKIYADDVVIQHISVRIGDEGNISDGIESNTSNVVIDHCSISWAIDENLSVGNGYNATFYRCIVSEGLSNSIHSKGEHSCGTLVMDGSEDISIIGNVYAHNFRRHPRLKTMTKVLFANNVIYNYGIYAAHIGGEQGEGYSESGWEGQGSFIGNTCLKGKDGWDDYFLEGHKGDFDKDMDPGNGTAYIEDNILLNRITGEKLIEHDEHISVANNPIALPDNLDIKDSFIALFEALRSAGARAGERSDIDKRIINDIINGTGEIIDSQNEVGGYPDYNSTTREINVPEDITKRQAWLDSIAASIDTDENLDVSKLDAFVKANTDVGSTTIDLESKDNLILFPNPTITNKIKIEGLKSFNQAYYLIIDLNGKTIQQGELRGNTIDISILTNGIYMLRIEVNGKVFAKKIIK